MRRATVCKGLALGVVALLSWAVSQAAPEDRINEAVPLPKSQEEDLQSLLSLAASADARARLQGEIDAKKKVRALNCAHGYSPSSFESRKQIQARLIDTECFAKSDDDLAHWAGWRRVGLLVELPPLRPVPTTLPSAIEAPFPIEDIRVAGRAGVMLLSDRKSVELVDLNGGRQLLSLEAVTSGPPGEISPNGRVFVIGSHERLSLMDSESGKELAALTDVLASDFFWLNGRAALFNRLKTMSVRTIAFDTGEERAENAVAQRAVRVAAIRQRPDEYLVFSMLSVQRMKLTQAPYGDPLTELDQRPTEGLLPFPLTGGLTVDGGYYANAANSLYLTSTATLETTVLPLNPFFVSDVFPLPDPNLLFIRGRVNGAVTSSRDEYVYSISEKTFAPVDAAQLIHSRVVYLPYLSKVGILSAQHLKMIDRIPVGARRSLEEFVADANTAVTRFQAQADRQPHAMLPRLDPSGEHAKFAGAAGGIQQPTGVVRNLEVRGQLGSTRDLGCIAIDTVHPEYTAADLYLASRTCVLNGRYDDSIPLFMLAGTYGRYDGARISDKTAAQGVAVMVMNFGGGFTPTQREEFSAAVQRYREPQARASVCAAIRGLGPPNYFPEYLILHGIQAFTRAAPLQNALDPNFDSKATWESLLKDGLLCTSPSH